MLYILRCYSLTSELETFSTTPTHMTDICAKFHWNPSTKYRDTSQEIGVNRLTQDGRPGGRPAHTMPITAYDLPWCNRLLLAHCEVGQMLKKTDICTTLPSRSQAYCDLWHMPLIIANAVALVLGSEWIRPALRLVKRTIENSAYSTYELAYLVHL